MVAKPDCPRHPDYVGAPVAHAHRDREPAGAHSHVIPCCESHRYATRPHRHGNLSHSHPHPDGDAKTPQA